MKLCLASSLSRVTGAITRRSTCAEQPSVHVRISASENCSQQAMDTAAVTFPVILIKYSCLIPYFLARRILLVHQLIHIQAPMELSSPISDVDSKNPNTNT